MHGRQACARTQVGHHHPPQSCLGLPRSVPVPRADRYRTGRENHTAAFPKPRIFSVMAQSGPRGASAGERRYRSTPPACTAGSLCANRSITAISPGRWSGSNGAIRRSSATSSAVIRSRPVVARAAVNDPVPDPCDRRFTRRARPASRSRRRPRCARSGASTFQLLLCIPRRSCDAGLAVGQSNPLDPARCGPPGSFGPVRARFQKART